MERIEILKTVKENMDTMEDYISEDEIDTDENVIINRFSQNETRVDVASMLSVILAQRELDQKRIVSLNKKISEMDAENSKLDSKLHYTKMDLVNVEIKAETFAKELLTEKERHKKAIDQKNFHMYLFGGIILSRIFFLLFLY